MTKHWVRVAASQRLSATMVDQAKTDVLKHMLEHARSEVTDRVKSDNLKPDGDLMIEIRVEQWCKGKVKK